MELSKRDMLQIVQAILHRAKELEAELMAELKRSGECPHGRLQEITSLGESERTFFCKDCRNMLNARGEIKD